MIVVVHAPRKYHKPDGISRSDLAGSRMPMSPPEAQAEMQKSRLAVMHVVHDRRGTCTTEIPQARRDFSIGPRGQPDADEPTRSAGRDAEIPSGCDARGT